MPNEQDLTRRALNLICASPLGILMTCDEHGYPHGRWMHMLPIHGLRELYALTASGTRKIDHIKRHPQVSWIVTADHDETVLLKGRTTVNTDFQGTRNVWDHLAAETQRYAVGPLSDDDHLDLVTIETRVEEVELISPSLGVHVAQPIHLAHADP